MQVDVVNIKKEKVGTLELPDHVFASTVNDALLWEMVKAQRASWRRGTHATKTRAFVSGGGRKPYKQKGTGQARQGSSRAPNHVGGGKVFGPKPRSYAYRMPRSARRTALCSALSARVQADKLIVLDGFKLEKPQTKTIQGFLDRFGSQSALLVDVNNTTLALSARNLAKSKYIAADALNVYDILDHDQLVLTRDAVDRVVAKVQGELGSEGSQS